MRRLTAPSRVARVIRAALGPCSVAVSAREAVLETLGLTPAALATALAQRNLPAGTREGPNAQRTRRETAAAPARTPVRPTARS